MSAQEVQLDRGQHAWAGLEGLRQPALLSSPGQHPVRWALQVQKQGSAGLSMARDSMC